MYEGKKSELKSKAFKLARMICKSTLFVVPVSYDYNFRSGLIVDDIDEDTERFRTELELENFSEKQLEFIFEILDRRLSSYISYNWLKFTPLYQRIENVKPTIIPDDLKFALDSDYKKSVQQTIEERKLKIYKNYIEVRNEFLNQKQITNNHISNSKKLKTNLSVPELALLFKLIKELKPDIFNVSTDTELFEFISKNFQTKGTSDSDISIQKLRILFNKPDAKAASFWEKKLLTMLYDVKKIK